MKLAVVYTYAAIAGAKYEDYAYRFLSHYQQFPPGLEHESIVVLNGLRASSELTCLFSSLPHLRLLEHDNSGFDIGAFQKAAREVPCDMMVFFGASTFFTRAGWLIRMVNAVKAHSPTQYGAMGNRGDIPVNVWPHIRTTAFWCPPNFMNEYPVRVTRPDQRHPFEHGKNCFTEWLRLRGIPSRVITWQNDFLWKDWDNDPNGYQRGNQSNLLAGDHMNEPPYYPRR